MTASNAEPPSEALILCEIFLSYSRKENEAPVNAGGEPITRLGPTRSRSLAHKSRSFHLRSHRAARGSRLSRLGANRGALARP